MWDGGFDIKYVDCGFTVPWLFKNGNYRDWPCETRWLGLIKSILYLLKITLQHWGSSYVACRLEVVRHAADKWMETMASKILTSIHSCHPWIRLSLRSSSIHHIPSIPNIHPSINSSHPFIDSSFPIPIIHSSTVHSSIHPIHPLIHPIPSQSSTHQSVRPSIRPSYFPAIYWFISSHPNHPFINPFVRLSVHPIFQPYAFTNPTYTLPSIHPPARINPSVCPAIQPSLYPSLYVSTHSSDLTKVPTYYYSLVPIIICRWSILHSQLKHSSLL